tara:strand:+ start:193 stop:534 length:342 start_codon:yes stop_codon:yes gene_type:complete
LLLHLLQCLQHSLSDILPPTLDKKLYHLLQRVHPAWGSTLWGWGWPSAITLCYASWYLRRSPASLLCDPLHHKLCTFIIATSLHRCGDTRRHDDRMCLTQLREHLVLLGIGIL